MQDSRDIKGLVALVTDGLHRREPAPVIVAKLVAAGVPPDVAPSMCHAIKTACQQGVLAVVTEGMSAPDGPPNDPILAEAFRVGQASMRRASRRPGLRAVLLLLLLVAAVAVWLLVT